MGYIGDTIGITSSEFDTLTNLTALATSTSAQAIRKTSATEFANVTFSAGTGISLDTSVSNVITINATGDLSVALSDVSTNSTTAALSLYTMTSNIAIEFESFDGNTLLYLDETNERIGIGTSTTTGKLNLDGGHFLFITDNTYDIGASGATRPRTGYFGTSIFNPLLIGGTATTSDLTLQTTSGVGAAGADMHFLVGNNGATEAMTILNSGNVGIGTTGPTELLEVVRANAAQAFYVHSSTGTNGASALFENTGGSLFVGRDNSTGGTYSGVAYANVIWGTGARGTVFGTNNTAKMIIESGGNVGIGTTAPGALLEARTNVATNENIFLARQLGAGDAAIGFQVVATQWSLGIDNSDSDKFKISKDLGDLGADPKLSIDTTGNVGIGTASPAVLLDVRGAAAIGSIGNTAPKTDWYTTTYKGLEINGSGAVFANALGEAFFSSNYYVRDDSGIARDTYMRTAEAANIYMPDGDIIFRTAPSGTAGTNITFTANMVIDQSANAVGIGTTTPSVRLGQKLDVAASANYGGASFSTWSATAGEGTLIDLNRSKSATIGTFTSAVVADDLLGAVTGRGSDGVNQFRSAAEVSFWAEGTFSATSAPGYIVFKTVPSASTSFTERMRITSAGNVGIGTTAPTGTLDVSRTYTVPATTTFSNIHSGGTFTNTSNGYDFYGVYSNILNAASTNFRNAVSVLGDASGFVAGVSYPYAIMGITASGGTFSNQAGLYLGSSIPASISGAYAIYSDLAAKSYFSGSVGIGTTAPGQLLEVYKDSNTAGPQILLSNIDGAQTNKSLTLTAYGDGQNGGEFGLNTAGSIVVKAASTVGSGLIIGNTNNDFMAFGTNNLERMRILAGGNVGIGTTAPDSLFHLSSSASTRTFTYVAAAADNSGPLFDIKKARGTIASPTLVSSGDDVGVFNFSGYDGNSYEVLAQIKVEVDGTAADGDMPGSISFITAADGGTTLTERMKINNAGQVSVIATTASTSTTTGSLINAGGFGNAGALHSGAQIVFGGTTTSSGAGAVGITGSIHEITTTGTGDALTLADGTEGQRLTIVYVAEGAGTDTAVLTPTNFGSGSTITFSVTGQSARLIFTNAKWYADGAPQGAVIA